MLRSCLYRLLTAIALFAFAFNVPASARPDVTQTGHDITIGSGQQASDVTCLRCNIYVRGAISGDATAVLGSIFVEGDGQISGDATAVGGSLYLDSNVSVGGDATVVGGRIRRNPGAKVGGDVTSLGGPAWIPLFLLFPLLVIGGIVAFIVWLVRRESDEHVAPAAAA